MDASSTPSIIIGLSTAIAALAGYIVKLQSIDRKDRKEAHAEMVQVVKQNIEMNAGLKASLDANTKTMDAMHRSMTDYMRVEH